MNGASLRDCLSVGWPEAPDPDFDAPHLVTEIPGPKARALVSFDERYTSPSLPRAYPFVPARGRGCVLEDVDGNRFLDFCAGIAVNLTGHAHPAVVAAVRAQAGRLLHYSASDFYLPIYAELAAALSSIAPISGPTRVFLGNSGTEAVEAAIKLARYASGRPYIIGFLGGFHGRSYGALSLGASKARYHAGFGPLLPGVYHVPFGSGGLDELEGRLFQRLIAPQEVAAIFVEPIQGEGGIVVPDEDFLPRLRRICDVYGILLVADEVQSGLGRTGRMWAIEHAGVEPDILLTAKGLASGLPLGAMIARESLMTWPAGAHGSTFGGNPVSCAAALATLELLADGLVENAAARGEQLLSALRALAAAYPTVVRGVRGRGLLAGVQFDSGPTAVAVEQAAFTRGLLTLTAGDDVVRLTPPLVVSEPEIAIGVQLFGAAVKAVVELVRRGRLVSPLRGSFI
jgi:4-aminobutyrate aminotransferase